MSITIPAIFKGLSKTQMRAFVREFSANLRFARSMAVSRKNLVTVNINLEKNSYKITASKKAKINQKTTYKENIKGDKIDMELDKKQTKSSLKPEFDDELYYEEDKKTSSKPYRIAGFRLDEDAKVITKGTILLHFFPLGNSDGGEFIIKGAKENFQYIVAIEQLTGRVTIREERNIY